jgi:hypothetical protein
MPHHGIRGDSYRCLSGLTDTGQRDGDDDRQRSVHANKPPAAKCGEHAATF